MTVVRRILLPRPRKPAEQTVAPPMHPDIVQRESDGLWSIGWHEDPAGPFESRTFAQAVAARSTQPNRAGRPPA
jgi:hypothetical protein